MPQSFAPVFVTKAELTKLIKCGVRVVDTIAEQIDELCEVRFPRLRDKPEKLAHQKVQLRKTLLPKSVWCYFAWRNVVVRLLEAKHFAELRTARNQNLITKREQTAFAAARVAVAGLSVGSNIARMLTLQGGPESMHLADADTLSLSNLNRILASTADLGKKKTEILAEALYEMNPFIKLTLFSDGLTQLNCKQFLFHNNKPVQVLVEEVDSLPMKIELRKLAAQYTIPLVSITDNGDGVLVDVERYDQGFTGATFAKKIKKLPKQLKTFSERAMAVTKFIGVPDIETRMLDSILEVGKSLYSWPQLGGAAMLSGVVGAYCVRQIVNGYALPSGRYIISLPKIFKTKHLINSKARQKVLRFFK